MMPSCRRQWGEVPWPAGWGASISGGAATVHCEGE